MIKLTKGTNVLDINLSDFSGAGQDVVQNGSFDNVGSDLIQNGGFSEISTDLIGNGEFDELGTDVITNGGFTGTELIDNGTFTTDLAFWSTSSWWVWNALGAYHPSTSSHKPLYQEACEIGKTYLITFDLNCVGSSLAKFSLGSSSGSTTQIIGQNLTTGSYSYVVTAAAEYVIFNRQNTAEFYVNNVSVKEEGEDWTNGIGWSFGEDKAISTQALGSEEVTNGDFATDGTPTTTSWSLGWYSNTSNVEITGGRLTMSNSASETDSRAYATNGTTSNNILTTNKLYKLQYDIVENNGVTDLRYYSSGGIFIPVPSVDVGSYTVYIKNTSNQLFLFQNITTNSSISIDNVSVKEIATSYLTQAVSLSAKTWKIIYSVSDYLAGSVSATDYGAVTTANAVGITEYVEIGVASDFRMVNIDGYFEGAVTDISAQLVDPNGYWTLQTGWAFGNSKASYDAVTNARNIKQLLNFELGKSYKIQFTISTGTARLKFTNESGDELFTNIGIDEYSPDLYTLYGKAIASTELRIYAYNNGGGEAFSITNISVEELDPNDYWTLGTGAVIRTNELNVNNGNGLVAYQPSILDATGYYVISFLVSDYYQGFIKGYVSNVTGDSISSDGPHTQYIQGSSTADVGVYCTDNFIGNVTNIVVKQFDTNNRWVTFADPDSKSVMKLGQVDLEIDSSNSNCGVYQTGLIKPNNLYIITINMKATAALNVEIAASLGTAVSAVIGTTALTTEFKEYSFEYVTPFAVAHDLQIHRVFGSGPNQTISIDYVSMNGVDESQWINDPTWNPFATSLVFVPTLTDESTNNSKQFTLDTSITDGGWDGRSLHGQITINEFPTELPASGIINLKQPDFLEGFYQVEIRGYLGTFYRVLGKCMAHLERASTEDGYNRFESYNDTVTYKAYEE
jgi:hypothetical protein